MAKISRPILYVLVLGGVAYGVVVATEPEPKQAPAKAKPMVASKPVASLYQPEDMKTKFLPLNEPSRDSFKPIVARLGGSDSLDNSTIPASFAGGDGKWVYTGTAEVDGVPMALIENQTTGDGVFLKQGERWKNAILTQIREEAVVFTGPGGEIRTVKVIDPASAAEAAGVRPAGVDPQMQGPIGGGAPIMVQPGPGAVPGGQTTAPAPVGGVQLDTRGLSEDRAQRREGRGQRERQGGGRNRGGQTESATFSEVREVEPQAAAVGTGE